MKRMIVIGLSAALVVAGTIAGIVWWLQDPQPIPRNKGLMPGYGSVDNDDSLTSNAEVTADKLNLDFVDHAGKPLRLGDYRGKKHVALVFMRGMTKSPGGMCPFCSAQTSRLIANSPQFSKRDTEVMVVFPGAKAHVAQFIKLSAGESKQTNLPFPVLMDEDFRAVDRLGIRADLAKPSTFIVDKEGQVRFAYVGATAADRPSLKAMLKQLDALAPAKNESVMSAIVCSQCGAPFAESGAEETVAAACPVCQSRAVQSHAVSEEPALPLTQPAASVLTADAAPGLATIGVGPSADSFSSAAAGLPGYDLLEEIGRGGMGVVYRARQLALDRVVALKALNARANDDPSRLARFEQEARTVARLRHANIVTAFDLLKHAGSVYLVMELLEGEDLDKRVQRLGPLDEATTWSLVRQAASALAHAAAAGIVHRDVKPANMILVAADGQSAQSLLKVTDFGLALLVSEPVGEQQLTNPGVLLGTPAYMAPEQFAGSHVDWRADVYALGVSAVYMLTNQQPYERQSLWEIMKRKMEGDLPLPDRLSPESKALLAKMLARRPEERFSSYQELLDAIDQRTTRPASPSEPRLASRLSGPWRSRPKWLVALLLLIFSAVIAVAVWTRQGGQPAPPHMLPGKTLALFNGVNLAGWLVGNGNWRTEVDEEGGTVLSGMGVIRRPIPKMPYYRLLMGVDLRNADVAEIDFGLHGGARQVLRIQPETVVLGEQSGEGGAFQEIARKPRAKASPGGIEAPYRELRVERTPKGWFAYYHGQLVGRVPIHDDEASEFRLRCEGGPAFFESIEVTELVLAD